QGQRFLTNFASVEMAAERCIAYSQVEHVAECIDMVRTEFDLTRCRHFLADGKSLTVSPERRIANCQIIETFEREGMLRPKLGFSDFDHLIAPCECVVQSAEGLIARGEFTHRDKRVLMFWSEFDAHLRHRRFTQ